MIKQTLVPMEEYLRTSYDPDVDYVDGALEERNLGELEHSDLQGEILLWIRTRYRPELNAFVELRIQVAPTRFRVPDVLILQRKRPPSGVLTRPPLAIVEVLSPEDRFIGIRARMNDYLHFGVRHCWLVDPESRTAWEYTLDGSAKVNGGILRCSDPTFEIPLPQIFAAIDENTES